MTEEGEERGTGRGRWSWQPLELTPRWPCVGGPTLTPPPPPSLPSRGSPYAPPARHARPAPSPLAAQPRAASARTPADAVPTAPASPALTPPPHAPLPVTVAGRDVLVEGVKTPLLTGLPPALARAVPGPGPGDVVLGFSAAGGRPTALEDIPLGQVYMER